MIKIFNKNLVSILLTTLLSFGININKVNLTQKAMIVNNLYIIGSIYVDKNNNQYSNPSFDKLVIEGMDEIKIEQVSTKLVEDENGYVLYYRGIIRGNIDIKLIEDFKNADFLIDTSGENFYSNHKVYVSKFVTGLFYYRK